MESESDNQGESDRRKPVFVAQHETITDIIEAIKKPLGVGEFDVNVELVSREVIEELNLTHRGINRPTDVLSFPQLSWESAITTENPYNAASLIPSGSDVMSAGYVPAHQTKILGDIIISPIDAFENASKIGQSLDREVAFLIIHGLLHLCGHDHKEEKQEILMLQQQRQLLSFLQPSDGTPIWFNCVRVEA